MQLTTMKTGAFRLGALMVAMGIIGVTVAPANASAFWWPWGHNHAHAQTNNEEDTVTITIQKYIDGEPATSENADDNAFAMTSSWDNPGEGQGFDEFELSAETSPAYQKISDELNEGADYSVNEELDGDIVSASCEDEKPYALVGYSVGEDEQAAAAANKSTDAPSFTDLSEDQYVIVWNETCDDDDDNDNATTSGSISGEVTGGSSSDPGDLVVTSIDAQKTTAIANGEFVDGWQYVFNITVPTDEPNLAMKFADWLHSGGEHTIPVANNMRISSDQADNASSTILLTAANNYSSPDLHMTEDLDENEDGLQVQVLVEVAVPSDTFNGTYSTDYGIRTLP